MLLVSLLTCTHAHGRSIEPGASFISEIQHLSEPTYSEIRDPRRMMLLLPTHPAKPAIFSVVIQEDPRTALLIANHEVTVPSSNTLDMFLVLYFFQSYSKPAPFRIYLLHQYWRRLSMITSHGQSVACRIFPGSWLVMQNLNGSFGFVLQLFNRGGKLNHNGAILSFSKSARVPSREFFYQSSPSREWRCYEFTSSSVVGVGWCTDLFVYRGCPSQLDRDSEIRFGDGSVGQEEEGNVEPAEGIGVPKLLLPPLLRPLRGFIVYWLSSVVFVSRQGCFITAQFYALHLRGESRAQQ